MRTKATILLFLLILGVPVMSMAQSGLGSITGHVTDKTGAAIPGAKVTVTNNATQVGISTVANKAGIYEIFDINPGTYSVEASAPTFKNFVRSNILVQSEDKIGLDLRLDVGSTSETVTVTAEQPQLRNEDAQNGEVIDNAMIETLPVLSTNDGRDPFSLITLSGDVQGGGGRAGINLGLNGSYTSGQPDTRINGGRTGAVEYLVDGVPATAGFAHNVVNDTPTLDATEEFKVITNGFSAEYGRLSGGLLSITTKSGTNDFHGQLFEYNQNAFLNANTWGNDSECAANPVVNHQSCIKPNFRLNDFGVAVGGRVYIPHVYDGKGKTFFFFDYNGIRHSTSGNTTLSGTITDLERTGDLTDIGTCDPSSAGAKAGTCDPYAQVYDPMQPLDANNHRVLAGGDGRHIPAAEMDTLVQQYLKFLPHPNTTPIAGTGVAGNYLVYQPNSVSNNKWAIRVDHSINDKQKIFGRFTHNNGSNLTGPFYPTLATTYGTLVKNGFGAELHYDFAINPTTIFEAQVGGNFSPYSSGSFLPPSILSSSFGYGATEQSLLGASDIVKFGFGPFNEGWYTSCSNGCQFGQGIDGNTGQVIDSTNYDASAALTKVLSRHTLKFGYDQRRYYDNIVQQGQSNLNQIADGFAFDDSAVTQTVGQATDWSQQGQDNGIGQFLLGVDVWERYTNKLSRSLSNNYYAAYVQDDFKINPKLTLNMGLRWETETPEQEKHDNMTVWDPNAPTTFTMAPGFSWAGALGMATITDPVSGNQVPLTTTQQQSIATPSWVNNGGFPNGAIVAVNTAAHPSRGATIFHPYNFSPRLGFAYQYNAKTVLRGGFGVMYLPTSGSISRYGDTPGVNYTTTWDNQSSQYGANNGYIDKGGVYHPARTVENPWDPTQVTTWTPQNTVSINQQAASTGQGTGSVDIDSHMPHEFNWSFGIQRQLPNKWLLEFNYSGNNSNTLLTVGNPSHFPKQLYVPQNYYLYTKTTVPSPTAGQVAASDQYTGPTQPLGVLEYPYPDYGPVIDEGKNVGSSHFESGQLRIERRFADGFQLLFNYTYSKALDDAGGADNTLNSNGGTGSNGKQFQTVDDSVASVYGYSANDEKQRINTFYSYELPVGRGRRFLGSPDGVGGIILDSVIGGWMLSGDTEYRSGRPLNLNVNGENADGQILNDLTFGSLAPNYSLKQLRNAFGSKHPLVINGAPQPGAVPDLDVNAIQGTPGGQIATVQNFTYGNIPSTIGFIRNPGNWNSNLSVMKSFPISKDAARYFQLRLDGDNFLNHPGYGQYDENTSDHTYGYINGQANNQRTVQIGGRLVF